MPITAIEKIGKERAKEGLFSSVAQRNQPGKNMGEQGVFAVHRRLFEHPLFKNEPFTEREAWIWMISEAAWKSTKVRVNRTVFIVERGQFVHALRFLAKRWQWSEARVRRFLERLKLERMIDALPCADATRIRDRTDTHFIVLIHRQRARRRRPREIAALFTAKNEGRHALGKARKSLRAIRSSKCEGRLHVARKIRHRNHWDPT